MTTMQASEEIIERDGVIAGPTRRPRNLARTVAGSIHDDATAQKLGFRGGTVAGSIHMEQFPPILVRAFGEQWFERGGLSTYFRNATTDGEPVRAFAKAPAAGGRDAQTDVWMERDDGTLVLEGTASIGEPGEPSMLRRKLAEPREAGEIRILSELRVGEVGESVRVQLKPEDARPRLKVITEPMEWYTGASPWGGPIVNPGLVVHLMVSMQRRMRLPAKAVGLYGAIEVRHIAGPVFAEREYNVSGMIHAIGQTPKTEYLWYETVMREPGSGRDVASMLMMLRFMKASSPLWASK